MSNNGTLTSLDLRHNPGFSNTSKFVHEIERIIHNNEHRARTAAGHP